jgi:hypothetical protein
MRGRRKKAISTAAMVRHLGFCGWGAKEVICIFIAVTLETYTIPPPIVIMSVIILTVVVLVLVVWDSSRGFLLLAHKFGMRKNR